MPELVTPVLSDWLRRAPETGRKGGRTSPPPLGKQVVVVVGASSGIGREIALQYGARGASVVVAARNGSALDDLVEAIERRGGLGLAVPTDVAEWDQVERLADRAVERFGRIDTLVSCAGVSVFGTVADVPVEDISRVLQVNLMGHVHGIKAALPVMRRQHAGTIIGISSVLGVRAVPLQAAYCASKHGVEGLYESLRMEERRVRSGVRVTTILPGPINTPFYDVAPSRMGVRPAPIPPLYPPSAVAEAVLFAAVHERRRIIVGGTGAQLAALQRVSPALVDRVLTLGNQIFERQRQSQVDDGRSNLYQPAGSDEVTGSYGHLSFGRSLYTRALAQHPALTRILFGAATAGAALRVRRPRRPTQRTG